MDYIAEYRKVLDELEIKYSQQDTKDGSESALIMKTRSDKVTNLIVLTKFSKEAPIITIELFDFCKVADDDFGKVVMKLNELNSRYKFGKFYVEDDGDICIQEACIVDENSAMSEIWNLSKMLVDLLDRTYPEIMKTIYA